MSLESQLASVFSKGLDSLSSEEKRELADSLHLEPATKYTKTEADYRHSESRDRCGVCLHYDEGSCEKVAGHVDPYDVCDYFEAEYEVVGSDDDARTLDPPQEL